MLKSLYVKNFILIDEIFITFGEGLNIITGETGAGKSILVGALGAILGEQLDKDTIRIGAEKAVFEAIITKPDIENLNEFYELFDIDLAENQILIRRELNRQGRTRCFINDSPVSLKVLTELGEFLVDLHGQHQHQQLLKSALHVDYLDEYAMLQEARKIVKQTYLKVIELEKKLQDFSHNREKQEREREFLRFQLEEINKIAPEQGEDDLLLQEEMVLKNAELLAEKTSFLYHELYDKDGAVAEMLRSCEKVLQGLAYIDKRFEENLKVCENARISVEEISLDIQSYLENISFDSEKLEQIRHRITHLNGLKKKYGGTLDQVFEFKKNITEKLVDVENIDEKIEHLKNEINQERKNLTQYCVNISKSRISAAQKLSKSVSSELASLGMPKAEFKTVLEYKEENDSTSLPVDGKSIKVTSKGIDFVEFFFRANPGEYIRPLTKVASGGEISRIMLALKTQLAEADHVPILIFDEIDIGISGSVAQAVGRSLRNLAQTHQVLCITHLPQIASMAHHHFLVEKIIDGNQTKTEMRKLSDSERREQIAKLLGGKTVTDSQLKSASDLIKEAELAIK